jgi:hypothetical protein
VAFVFLGANFRQNVKNKNKKELSVGIFGVLFVSCKTSLRQNVKNKYKIEYSVKIFGVF